jgi:hypothetical protein
LLALGALASLPAAALYDPAPIAALEFAPGLWRGTLTYSDYQNPDKKVTLPSKMVATLLSPSELALYYEFDDGPSKTVYSYERMKLDLVQQTVEWHSGTSKPSRSESRLVSAHVSAGKSHPPV